ncbi:hypothetical protein GGS24DRAFT_487952 [Hypoxylon argillaceum]|nr:hypothetical protein GGS24DRAFT_487952 [Hypoxylon argillaceum]
MDYYKACLGGLVVLSAVLFVSQPTRKQKLAQRRGDVQTRVVREDDHPEARWYKAYSLAVAADWLQGPYLFSLYKDEYGLASDLVVNLYMTDIVTTAISAYFIGTLADKYGRKLLCMVYCVSYALSCFLTVVPATPLLYLGRVLGGLSSSILFTVFESWMVTGFHEGRLDKEGCDLSRTFAATGAVNGFVAIWSGLVGEVLVWATGTKKSPFLLSVGLLWLALQAIWSSWAENFGVRASPERTGAVITRSVWSVLKTPSILALVFASTLFDGSMNLFLSYWMPALNSLHKSSSELPYSIIHSSFMAVSIAAALAFNIIMDKRVIKYSRLLVGVLSVAVFCFVKLAGAKTETSAFWLFCLLEACRGVFGPGVGYLKASLIEDDARTAVYSLMRTPLNILVVVSVLAVKDNTSLDGIFTTCCLMLTASVTAMLVASVRGMP